MYLTWICTTLLLGSVLYGSPSIELDVTPNVAHIGDSIFYRITTDQKLDLSITKQSMAPFIIRRNTVSKTKNGLHTYEWELSIFELGEHKIPTQNAVNLEQVSYELSAIPIYVESILNPSENLQIAPLAPPIRIERSWQYAIYLLIVLVILGMAYVTYKKWKKKHTEQNALSTTQQNPYDIALNDLKRLSHKKLIDQNDIDAHYVEMSHILRQCLGTIHNIGAIEMTTSEILQHLQKKNVSDELIKRWRRVFEFCDTVKFASQKERSINHEELMEKIVTLLHKLKGSQT